MTSSARPPCTRDRRTLPDVENAHLTRIDQDSDYWEAIASSDDDDGQFPAGLKLDLSTTYCRQVIDGDGSIALSDAPDEGWADDPAFEQHGLHCYHGTSVTVAGELFGTVCFVSESPRAEPFTESDTLFAELVARLVEHELELHHREAETVKRANSVTVLSRVLRHNIRNEMTVLRGDVGRLAERLDGESFSDVRVERTTRAGDTVTLSISTAPLQGKGGVEGVVAVAKEVTDDD